MLYGIYLIQSFCLKMSSRNSNSVAISTIHQPSLGSALLSLFMELIRTGAENIPPVLILAELPRSMDLPMSLVEYNN